MTTTRTTKRWRAAIIASLTSALGYGIIQLKRDNKRAAIAALRDAVEPPQFDDPREATEVDLTADVAHAPGHRHLTPPPRSPRAMSVRRAGRRADRNGHPGRFS